MLCPVSEGCTQPMYEVSKYRSKLLRNGPGRTRTFNIIRL